MNPVFAFIGGALLIWAAANGRGAKIWDAIFGTNVATTPATRPADPSTGSTPPTTLPPGSTAGPTPGNSTTG